MEKTLTRKQYIKIRDSIQDRDIKEKIIYDKLLEFLDNDKIIMSYMNIKSEVSTKDINNKIKNLVLPIVCKDYLIPKKVFNIETDTKLGAFNIVEPKESQPDAKHIDIVIVPAVCFSKNMQRIGYGKGFYDRFLENKEILKIGICFEEQMLQYLTPHKFDVAMDMIITDKNIY